MADNTAPPIASARDAKRSPKLRPRGAGDAVPAPVVLWRPTPVLSPSSDVLGIGPIGWAAAAILLVAVALASAMNGLPKALPETPPVVVHLALETPPPPPASPEAAAPVAPSLEPAPSAEPPEAAPLAPAPAEEPSLRPAPPPIVAAPSQALPQAPPRKPPAPAQRHRAAAAATTLPRFGPPNDASLPIVPPRPISGMADNAVPDYSARASEHHVEGEVILRVEVSSTGNLISVTIARSSGNDVLDQAALLVVRHWRFTPATRGGEPVAGTAEVPIWSRLDD